MKAPWIATAVMAVLGSSGARAAATTGEWVTLGTAGGPPIHATQSQIANALVVGETVYMFDAGDGVLRQMAAANIPVAKIKAMFLTHHHPDHVMGVGALMLSRSATAKPMEVLGPPGTKQLIEGLARAYGPVEAASYGAGAGKYKDTVTTRDFAAVFRTPTVVYHDENIKVSAVDVDHFQAPPPPKGRVPRAVAYRIEVGGRVIVFTGDMGPSDSIIPLAKDADVFISEVVDPDVVAGGAPGSNQANWARNHVMPRYVGHYAAAAGVKLVVLTHFVGKWGGDNSGFLKGLSDEYKGPVKLARDLDRF